MAQIIYLLLCIFGGYTCAKLKIETKDWQYWAILGCIVGAYFYGICS